MKPPAAAFYIISISCVISLTRAAPKPENTSDDLNFDVLQNENIDYNTMMAHFRDFFMYLPVVFNTFRETMSGFPKLAEGIRILTSPNYEKPDNNDDGDGADSDCKCKRKVLQNANAIAKSDVDSYK